MFANYLVFTQTLLDRKNISVNVLQLCKCGPNILDFGSGHCVATKLHCIARRLYKEGDNKYDRMKNLYILGWEAASELYSEEGVRYGNKKGNSLVGTHYPGPLK